MSLFADDSGAAMLRSNAGVLLNKNPAPPSSALFPDDLIETQKNAVARIEAAGSTAEINPESMVQFEGIELFLEHGSVSVSTSRGMKVRVGCMTVTPVNLEPTHYDVTDTDGKVTVSALKNDVYIESRSTNPKDAKRPEHSNRSLVREGERKSREEKCGGAYLGEHGAIAAKGAILNSPYVQWSAVGVIGLTCWLLCTNDDPVSPSVP